MKPRREDFQGASLGVFATLLLAAVLVGSFGVLLESGLRAHAPVERYRAAKAVVTAPGNVEIRTKSPGAKPKTQKRPRTELPRIPVAAADRLRQVLGVRAVVPDVSFPVVASGGAVLSGHGWDSAALRPAALAAGRAPQASDEVVLPAGTEARVGQTIKLQANGAPTAYRVTGLVGSGPAAAYFAPDTAFGLSGHPGFANAFGVLADHGTKIGDLRAAAPGLSVLTGSARGDAEDPSVAAVRPDVVEMGAAVGGTSLITALIVVGGLLGLQARRRSREYALLRAVGATPGQVRGTIVREALRTALPAAAIGGVLSLGGGALLHAAMHGKGVLPPGLGLALSPLPALGSFALTVAATVVVALLASLRVSGIRPAQALGETAADPVEPRRRRIVAGALMLAGGLASLGVTLQASGDAAAASLSSMVMSLMVGVALLSPVLARFGARILGGVVVRFSPTTGRLARHAAAAAAPRAGAVLTPVALVIAFALVQLSGVATTMDATAAQASAADRAERVVVSSGPGVPSEIAEAVRNVPGVAAVTPVRRTTVVMARKEMGDTKLRSLPARGLGADAARTVDAKLVKGGLDGLTGTSVALGKDIAGGARIGSSLTLWLGDGTRISARVVAVYDRALGLGSVLLPRDLVAAHSGSALDDHVLVRCSGPCSPQTSRALDAVTARYTGVRAVDHAAFGEATSRELRTQELLSQIIVAAIGGFVLAGVVTTRVLATTSRRRELALLRKVGATRAQVRGSVRLEGLIVFGTGAAAGLAVAAVTTAALAVFVSGQPIPSLPFAH
ncbi:ABC transporter permease [Actinomadura rupiterrae]|uniref:ABC transporter permease n=1 Tax=Actinomadura rupiterrae TaxID=559627 RepID=UPI0020A3DB1B|nr:ABC transporter permease [Actinomadura rupiterrae]MCP2340906.1 putative ABC transport system permease protein [Actinomadura rupiterrae]